MVIMEKTSERDGSSQEAELPTFASAAAAAGSTNRPPG
jgi:hypothetical protein